MCDEDLLKKIFNSRDLIQALKLLSDYPQIRFFFSGERNDYLFIEPKGLEEQNLNISKLISSLDTLTNLGLVELFGKPKEDWSYRLKPGREIKIRSGHIVGGGDSWIIETNNGDLFVNPHYPKPSELNTYHITINGTITTEMDLELKILKSYFFGYDGVEIESESGIGSNVRERVNNVVQNLIAVDITLDTPQCIKIGFLLARKTLPEKFVEHTLKELYNGDEKSATPLLNKDRDLVKRILLLVRILNSSKKDSGSF